MIDEIVYRDLGDGVAELRINRPAKHNAITPAMGAAIRDIRRQVNDDDSVRAVVVSGAGERAFCAGTDIGMLDTYKDAWAFRSRVCYATEIRRIKKPTIAALKGWTLGGGLEIAINCDIRIAAPSTRIGAPEVKHGWLGGGGSTQMLTRLVGYGKAMMMCLTGDTYSSDDAYRMGVVEMLVGEGEEVAAATEMARRIAGHTTIATQTVKAGVRAALSGSLELGARYENDLMILAFALGNQRQGIDKFAAKDE